MFWLISQFPELDHLDPEQRAKVLSRAPWWTYPLIIGRSFAPGAIVIPLGLCCTVHLAITIPVAVGLAFWMYLRQINRLRTEMRAEIMEQYIGDRPPICLECGYDLRGSAADRCPECGAIIPGTETAWRTQYEPNRPIDGLAEAKPDIPH